MWTVAVLGPLEVHRDTDRVAIPAGKAAEVLIRLALEPGTPVRAERIIDDLWPAGAEKNTLQSKVSQLRRALGGTSVLVASHGGYRLAVDPGSVDATQVGRLTATAAEHRRAGDLAGSMAVCTQGLELFRGDVLADAGDGEWVRPHRARLEEIRMGLQEDQLAARVLLAPDSSVIAELEALVQHHPLREQLWHSLITALYRTGRQSEALAGYARVRQLLVDELGVEPGPELQDLEQQVLQHSPALSAATPATAAASPVDVRSRSAGLPTLSAPLIGRGEQLSQLLEHLRRHRLVTLVGPAGVGKTRLAIEAGRTIAPPGQCRLIRFDTIDSPAAVVGWVVETLGAAGEAALIDRLSAVDTLLILDNCEHLSDDVAGLATSLLDGAARCRILATSQLALGVDGEFVVPVDPLPETEAIALFLDRAAAAGRRSPGDDPQTAAVIAQICRSLDGLPLAIELAAARVRSLPVAEIARRLDHRFALLRDPAVQRPDRRRALGAALGWSYDLLFPDDQRGLWALSTFAGGASLAAAESVLSALGVPPVAAVDVIDRLAARSLLTVDMPAADAVRYRMLDSIRAFAADRLAESGSGDDAFAAHARWYADQAHRLSTSIRTSQQPACLEFVRAERADIDAALAWSAGHDPVLGLQMANDLGWTWVVLGDGTAGADRLVGALTAAELSVAAPKDLIVGRLQAGWLEASAGNVERAEEYLETGRRLADDLQDRVLIADAERHFAFLRLQQARPLEAAHSAEQSLVVYRDLDMTWDTAGSLLLSASAAMMLGDAGRAAAAAAEAVTLMTDIGDAWVLVHAEAMLGAIAQATHRFPDAEQHLRRAAEDAERLGFVGQSAYHRTRLGRVQQQAGDAEAARVTLSAALDAAIAGGDLRMAATARLHLARALRWVSRTDEAGELLRENMTFYRAAGGGDGALLTECLLASLSMADTGREPPDLTDLVERARAARDVETEVLTLDLMAFREARGGNQERARHLLSQADALALTATQIVDAVDRPDAISARALLAGNVFG